MRLRISPGASRFTDRVAELSGENLRACYQCGECSSGCPLASEMDLLPSTIIRLVQLGQEEVLDSKTIWVCSSCLTCAVRCPQQIDVAKVMEALRQLNLRKNIDRIRIEEIPLDERRRLPQIAMISSFRKQTA